MGLEPGQRVHIGFDAQSAYLCSRNETKTL
jgi:hypothetical protein